MITTSGVYRVFSRVFTFQVMLATLLGGWLWVLAWGRIAEPDMWWHMRNAEYLLQNREFLRHDMYSFTAAGWEWINHAWLSEIPLYLAWRAGGLVGVNALWVCVVGLIFAGLLHLSWRESGNFKAAVLACGFCSLMTVVSFGPRTIHYAYLCVVALLTILQRFRIKRRGPLWLVPPLMCLWINTHGSWPLGFLLLGIFTASGLFECHWGRMESVRWSASELVKLIVTGAASAAAVFVNPYGWLLVRYPLDLASKQKLNVAHIEEWMSVDFHQGQGKVSLALLFGLLAAAWIRNQRWRLGELGWLLLALYMGLTYVRFQFFLAIVAAPILAKILDILPPYDRQQDKPVLNFIIIAFVVYGVARYYQPPTAQALQETIAATYPAEAVAHLKTLPPDSRVLNDFVWGGYLIWNVRELKVFVDSRVDIFEYSGVFQDYVDWMSVNKVDSIVDKYKIRYVLSPVNGVIPRYLENDPGWTVAYRDKVAILFEKSSP